MGNLFTSSQNTKSTQSTQIPADYKAAMSQGLGMATTAANQPYQAYTDPRVANLTGYQNQAISSLSNNFNQYDPLLQAASQSQQSMIQGGGLPTGADIQALENPYTTGVLGAAQNDLFTQYQQSLNQLQGNAAQAGAWGDRLGVSEGAAAGAYATSANQLFYNGMSDNYNQAVNNWFRGQDNSRANNTTGTNIALSGTNQNINNANALYNLSQGQQNVDQANLDFNYQQFADQQNYATKQSQNFNSIVDSYPSQLFTKNSNTTQTSTPSLGSVLMGAAMTAAGAAAGDPGLGSQLGSLFGGGGGSSASMGSNSSGFAAPVFNTQYLPMAGNVVTQGYDPGTKSGYRKGGKIKGLKKYGFGGGVAQDFFSRMQPQQMQQYFQNNPQSQQFANRLMPQQMQPMQQQMRPGMGQNMQPMQNMEPNNLPQGMAPKNLMGAPNLSWMQPPGVQQQPMQPMQQQPGIGNGMPHNYGMEHSQAFARGGRVGPSGMGVDPSLSHRVLSTVANKKRIVDQYKLVGDKFGATDNTDEYQSALGRKRNILDYTRAEKYLSPNITPGLKKGGFIQKAIKHPGVFSAAAKRTGKSTSEYAQTHKHDSGTLGNRARLALTLMGMNKKAGGGQVKQQPYGPNNPEPGLYDASEFGWKDVGEGLSNLGSFARDVAVAPVAIGDEVGNWLMGRDNAYNDPNRDYTHNAEMERERLTTQRHRDFLNQFGPPQQGTQARKAYRKGGKVKKYAGGGQATDDNQYDDKTITEGLVNRGFTPEQAAAVTGNMYGESSYDTNAMGDDGSAYGLMQWRGDRLSALQSMALQRGVPQNDLNLQLDYAARELQGKGREAKNFQRAMSEGSNLPDRTALFTKYVERPSAFALQESTPRRINAAQQAYRNANMNIDNSSYFAGRNPGSQRSQGPTNLPVVQGGSNLIGSDQLDRMTNPDRYTRQLMDQSQPNRYVRFANPVPVDDNGTVLFKGTKRDLSKGSGSNTMTPMPQAQLSDLPNNIPYPQRSSQPVAHQSNGPIDRFDLFGGLPETELDKMFGPARSKNTVPSLTDRQLHKAMGFSGGGRVMHFDAGGMTPDQFEQDFVQPLPQEGNATRGEDWMNTFANYGTLPIRAATALGMGAVDTMRGSGGISDYFNSPANYPNRLPGVTPSGVGANFRPREADATVPQTGPQQQQQAQQNPLDAMMNDFIQRRMTEMNSQDREQKDPVFGLFSHANVPLMRTGLAILANSNKNFGEALGTAGLQEMGMEQQEKMQQMQQHNNELKDVFNMQYMRAQMGAMSPQAKQQEEQKKWAQTLMLRQLDQQNKMALAKYNSELKPDPMKELLNAQQTQETPTD